MNKTCGCNSMFMTHSPCRSTRLGRQGGSAGAEERLLGQAWAVDLELSCEASGPLDHVLPGVVGDLKSLVVGGCKDIVGSTKKQVKAPSGSSGPKLQLLFLSSFPLVLDPWEKEGASFVAKSTKQNSLVGEVWEWLNRTSGWSSLDSRGCCTSQAFTCGLCAWAAWEDDLLKVPYVGILSSELFVCVCVDSGCFHLLYIHETSSCGRCSSTTILIDVQQNSAHKQTAERRKKDHNFPLQACSLCCKFTHHGPVNALSGLSKWPFLDVIVFPHLRMVSLGQPYNYI